MSAPCRLCPRRCGAARPGGETGFCGAGRDAVVYTYGRHMGEEPPLCGDAGSGAVFFSGCALRCVYCQNYLWSHSLRGERYSPEQLAAVFAALCEEGCLNWNLVSPTPHLPVIVQALDIARQAGYNLPVVYNTSGFESVDTLRALEGCVDVYLTDLRYAEPATAAYASGRGDYVAAARAALAEMRRCAGAFRTDASGAARGGVICRVLILPGRAQEAVASLRWLAAEYADSVAVSVMAQYTPAYKATQEEPWNRPISREEYEFVAEAAESLNFETAWIQEYGPAQHRELLGFEMRPRGRPCQPLPLREMEMEVQET